jgi:hypothetical protein
LKNKNSFTLDKRAEFFIARTQEEENNKEIERGQKPPLKRKNGQLYAVA